MPTEPALINGAAPAVAIVYALFVWWFTTGLILLLDSRPPRTFRASFAVTTLLMLAALYALFEVRDDTTTAAAYVAFSASIMVWGWVEMAFLMGFVTGPRQRACVAGCAGAAHFMHAVQAILWHELLIVLAAGVILAIGWGMPNTVGAWVFLLLWGMRLSAKLNLFLGVPNLSEEFLPEHLRYLRSFFRRRAMNLLFPVSITGGTLLAASLIASARLAETGSFAAVAATLLATLTVLAVFEHWFMVLPLPIAALWGWGARRRAAAAAAEAAAAAAAGEIAPASRAR